MSLARTAARVIRQQLRAHVAWLPFANNLELGDFGVFSGGVFNRLGNVRGLGVSFATRSTAGAPFEFRSGGTTEVVVDVDAGGRLTAAAQGEAGLRIGFADANSLYLRAAEIEVAEISELLPVAAALRQHPQWRMRYRVIHRLWLGKQASFITSEQRDASIELRGSLDAVLGAQGGRFGADLQIHRRSNVGLDLIGHTGPLALGLFRVRLIGGTPDFVDFGLGGPSAPGPAFELDEPGLEDEPEDDL